MPNWADQSLADGREALLRWINNCRPQGSLKNGVAVIFDGSKEHWGGVPAGAGDVQVIFAQPGSADDRIKALVTEARIKQNCVVVTDDKGLKLYVRALGAQVMNVKKFMGQSSKGLTNQASAKAATKYISLVKAAQINKELEKIWLK